MANISLRVAKELCEKAKGTGQFFSVTFVKKDGTVRDMTCRGGVKKHLKGGELTFDPKEYNLLCVWDATIEDTTKAYRMINLNTLLRVKVDGVEYNVSDAVNI